MIQNVLFCSHILSAGGSRVSDLIPQESRTVVEDGAQLFKLSMCAIVFMSFYDYS